MEFHEFFSCMKPWASCYTIDCASYLLFYHITRDNYAVKEKVHKPDSVEDLSVPQRYYKYTTGKLRITKLASKIKNQLYPEDFINYLSQDAAGQEIRKELFVNFSEKKHEFKRKELFVDSENLFRDITEVFVDVINEAAAQYGAPKAEQSKEEQPPLCVVPAEHQKEILDIITKIRMTLEQIIKLSDNLTYHGDFHHRTRTDWKKIEQNNAEMRSKLTGFKELNDKLYSYSLMYPQLTNLRMSNGHFYSICDIIEDSQQNGQPISIFNKRVLAYSICLDDIIREMSGQDTILNGEPI